MTVRAGEFDGAVLNTMLKGIAMVESNCCDFPNKGNALHKDGKSYGRYGVTKAALKELQRLHRVPSDWKEIDLRSPGVNYTVAREYLQLMYERNKSWWKSVGWYHGGNRKRREEYSSKVFKYV